MGLQSKDSRASVGFDRIAFGNGGFEDFTSKLDKSLSNTLSFASNW